MKRYRLPLVLASLVAFGFLWSPALAKETKKKNSAVIPVPHEGEGPTKRQELLNSRVKEGSVDVLFIGDSITQGWEGNGAKEVWRKFYGNRRAVNLGIGGDQTQHVLWRLDHGNLDGISPKVAVLMIGTNNSGSNTSEEIADGVSAVVKKLHKKVPELKVLVLGIFPRGANDDDAQRQTNMKANAIIAKLADNKNVFYLDIGDKFLESDRTLSKEIMPDLLHLSAKGYTIWAESIEPTMKKLLEQQ